jgi:hypothetical protein
VFPSCQWVQRPAAALTTNTATAACLAAEHSAGTSSAGIFYGCGWPKPCAIRAVQELPLISSAMCVVPAYRSLQGPLMQAQSAAAANSGVILVAKLPVGAEGGLHLTSTLFIYIDACGLPGSICTCRTL